MSWGAASLLAALAVPAQTTCIPIARFQSPALFTRYPAPAIAGPWRAPDVSLYDWRGGGPRLIRFVAQRKLCRESAAE